MAGYSVQHCLLAATVRQWPPRSASDLLGVDYHLVVAADTEFPKTIGRVELFVRFVAHRVKPIRAVVSVTHLDAPGGPRLVYRKRFEVTGGRPPARTVNDVGLKLVNLELAGIGRYAVRLFGPRRSRWERRPMLGVDYFRVSRAV